jgi:hypothetical protein
MSRSQKVIGLLAVLKPKQIVAVFVPATGRLKWFSWQQCWEENFLGSGIGHLFADDLLDASFDAKSKRQPGEDTGGIAANVTSTDEQSVAVYFGVGGILAQGAQKK